MEDYKNVTRLEIIDHRTRESGEVYGRVLSVWDDRMKIEVSVQDNGQTLKIFFSKRPSGS